MLVLGNEGGGPHRARSSYTGPIDWFMEASGFDFEYSSNVQLRLKLDCVSLYAKANMNKHFNIDHIAICMCNSLKCWFKGEFPCKSLAH